MNKGSSNPFFTISHILKIVIYIASLGTSTSQTDCKSRINHHRSKYGIEHITEREDLHSCANRQSQYDKQMGAHKSFKRCGSLGSQGSGGGSNCASVIDAFFNERWRCTETAVFGSPIDESDEGSLANCRQQCMDNLECLSFDYDADALNSCRFYDEASLTHVKFVDGHYWLGAPEYTNSGEGVTVDGWSSFSLIDLDGSNAVPADGQITGFKWFGSNPNGVTFFVYRFVSDRTYEVVGKVQAFISTVGVENSIAASSPIDVIKGDVIGWTFDGAGAFGFVQTSEGEVRYRNKENTGGPNGIGDQWTFDGGPVTRRYHFAASYAPSNAFTPSAARNYCAAALCQGHCGPVLHEGTTTFSWGVWNNFYTLNWRPHPRLPSGGNECPSGIEAVKCWTDSETQVLWAYGVGGEDCHSTCSLAGASPADYMCDEETPITGGFDEVSNIMSNFENAFNVNDPDEFTCTTGTCWNGETSRQISIHEYNSDCYVPTNTEKYTCDSRFGNANCYGQRFNQVCPCKIGCSWAAGPSCSPSSTNSPTVEPTVKSTPHLSSAPSVALSSKPSKYLSLMPSESPILSCPSSDIVPHEYTLSARAGKSNHCYRIQFRNGGRLFVDTRDPGCTTFNSGGAYNGKIYSKYIRTVSGGIAMYEGTWNGSIALLQDKSLNEATLEVTASVNAKTFGMTLVVPDCGALYVCNSIVPNEYTLPATFGKSNYCYRIQVRDGGRLLVDTKDPGCTNFNAGNNFDSVSVSNYQRTDPGGIVIYQGKWSGSIELKRNPSLSEAKFELTGNTSLKTFSGTLTVPSCNIN